MDKRDLVVILLIYSLALILWSLPIRSSPMPFGDVDSSSHFTQGDYIYHSDRVYDNFPYYIFQSWYGGEGKRYYPPHFYIMEALAQLAGGEHILSPYIMILLLATLFILSTYILVRETLGFYPALISSFFLVFSMRDIMVYLWAQWPQQVAFVFIPMVAYTFYKYNDLLMRKKRHAFIYLLLTAISLAGAFSFHPQALLDGGLIISLFALFLIIKHKRFIYPIKHIILSVILLALLTAPFVQGAISYSRAYNVSSTLTSFFNPFKFYPTPNPSDGPTVFMASYKLSYGGLWTLPFVLLGAIFVLIRFKEEKYLLWVAILASHFILIHYSFRAFRYLSEEAHFFFPMFALGVYILARLKPVRKYKTIVIIIALLAILLLSAPTAFTTLKNAYPPPMRVTPAQYDAAMWIRDNLPQNTNIAEVGVFTLAKKYWMQALSMRNFLIKEEAINRKGFAPFYWGCPQYFLIDYSDSLMFGKKDMFSNIKAFERQIASNATLVFDNGKVKIYRLKNKVKVEGYGKTSYR